MPIRYKDGLDILAALREHGYTSTRLRKEHIFGESTMQKLRNREPISFENLGMLCELLECNVEDIIEYCKDPD